MNKNRLSPWLLGFGLIGSVQATELVYTPVNPAFGGNPLNGTWLLNNAQAQNDHDDPDLSGRTSTSALQRFTSQLESRLLSQILTNIQDGNTGSLTTDSFIVNMIDDGGELTIMITDRATGEVSEIVVDGITAN
ncbi:curli assembly protein CsgF [Pseudomonas sp. GCM10022186]|uniref:curli assembly protein CsgF n=1 Tax=Pseudomonas sp. GCM10022186 TaxID=3252650 RepID=UPI00360F7785